MQKFFYNFWESRNSLDPSEGWRKYHLEVRKVNKEFRNFKIQGYLTDRGRVYLQYGPPNSRNQIDDAASTYPYEIWHYYKLKNQTNKKFVFINSDFATNEYKLQYSNVYGEVSNSEWRDKIEQDQNPTFGDDFINNYNISDRYTYIWTIIDELERYTNKTYGISIFIARSTTSNGSNT